uniref:Uncharacterized protein n=1 Tax=Physcomitrium patens TaxID=3218 RepID=A0A7I4EU99_PHYPA
MTLTRELSCDVACLQITSASVQLIWCIECLIPAEPHYHNHTCVSYKCAHSTTHIHRAGISTLSIYSFELIFVLSLIIFCSFCLLDCELCLIPLSFSSNATGICTKSLYSDIDALQRWLSL